MFGNRNEDRKTAETISSDDLQEYAGAWSEAEQTKLWAEEQIKALVPPGFQLHVGSYMISRENDSIHISPSQ